MMPGAFSWLIINALLILIFFVMAREFNAQKAAWLLVWCVFSLAVVSHVWLLPNFFEFKRFFPPSANLGALQTITNTPVDLYGSMRVWAFFSVMWIIAWRVSLMNLSQVGILLTTILLVSLFQAIYGLYGFISGNKIILGLWIKEYYLRDATGTFVNRNHFAGMLAIAWPLVVSGLVAPKALIFPFLSGGFRVVIAVFYSMIVMLALVSSHSRMGTAAAIFGLATCLYIILRNSYLARFQKVSAIWQIVGVFLFLALFALWFGLGDIVQRYASLDGGDSRVDVWQAMFGLPFNVWLFGVGPGAFEDVFQLVKPSYFSVRFIYAHNDYLEFLFEFGLLVALAILCAVIFWFKKVYPKGNHLLRAGALGSIVAVAMHSLVDFNLQIPASALLAWVALGLVMNNQMVDIQEGDREQKTRQSSSSSKNSHSRNLGAKSKTRKRIKKRLPRTKQEWLAFLRSD